jgi:RNA polymerase sigma-70 factor (ECF subfamily)
MNRGEPDWTDLMRQAIAGNAAAYDSLLRDAAARLRPIVRRGLLRAGHSGTDAEDIVQEILIAVHLKRHTWDDTRPVGPWIRAIAHHKTIDALRRHGNRHDLPIDDFADLIAAEEPRPSVADADVGRQLATLAPGQRQVIQAIAIEGLSIGEAASRFTMKPGTVRVALHRAIRSLAGKAARS